MVEVQYGRLGCERYLDSKSEVVGSGEATELMLAEREDGRVGPRSGFEVSGR